MDKIESVTVCTMIADNGFQEAVTVIYETHRTATFPPVAENGYKPVLPRDVQRFMNTATSVESASGSAWDRSYKTYQGGVQ